MSVVTLQFGQCGNQIGQKLYNIINEDIQSDSSIRSNYCTSSLNQWFHLNKSGGWEPRSILIDTESKVVDGSKTLPFKFKNIVAKSYGGSANNWACGYNCRSALLKNEVLDGVRSEIEKCDYLTSILNIFSSSGGTGSGLGSCLIECLRSEYPNKNIVNAIVLPYNNGEIVTQSYNSILSLSLLYSVADSTILFENEKLHHVCSHTLNNKDVTFGDMNFIIAQQLAALYQPINNSNAVSLLSDATAHPSYKYLQINSEPHFHKDRIKFENLREWKPLIQALSKQSRFELGRLKHNNLQMKKKCVANFLISRGGGVCSENDLKPFTDTKLYVPWLTIEQYFKVYHQARCFNKLEKYLALLSNSNSVCLPLNVILDDAWNLFTHGAYLHHYKNFGVDEDDFLNAFQVTENVLNDYKDL